MNLISNDMPAPSLPQQPQPAARRRAWVWPALVIGLLAMQVGISGTMIAIATSDRSFAVEPNYYQKALHWDAQRAEQRASDALGWTLGLEIADNADAQGLRDVRCTLSDKQGLAVRGAALRVEAFARSRGADRRFARLAQQPDGSYAAPMNIDRAGTWEFRVTSSDGAQPFGRTLIVEVPAAQRPAP